MDKLKEVIDRLTLRSPIDEVTKILAHRIVDDLDDHLFVERIKIEGNSTVIPMEISIRIDTKPIMVLYHGTEERFVGDARGQICITLRSGRIQSVGRNSEDHPHADCLHTDVASRCREGKYSDAVYDLAMALAVMEHW